MKNIILISIDNLRFDCVGYQPDKKELKKYDVLRYLETPTLDRIAGKSHCFTKCISTNTYTTSAHASIFTGLYPPRHGIRSFYETTLSKNVYTLAEALKVFGYETAMMTDTPPLFQPLGLDRGFDRFFHSDEKGLLRFLEDKREKKNFVFAHFYDVHEPFLLSKNPAYDNSDYGMEIENLYDTFDFGRNRIPEDSDQGAWMRLVNHLGHKDHKTFLPLYVRGVSKFDRGRFSGFMRGIEDSGFMKDSLLIIFSDHGEGKASFYDHEVFAHGGPLFDSVIRVPLIIYRDGYSQEIIDRVVSTVDIFPTILNSLPDVRSADMFRYRLDGVDLNQSELPGGRAVYSETWQRDNKNYATPRIFISSFLEQRGIRTKNRKYIINGTPEVFLDKDAVERMTDEAFLQNIYRGLLCRFEDYEKYFKELYDLRDKRTSRGLFFKKVKDSLECLAMPSSIMYDLEEDPLEERYVPIGDGADETSGYFKEIYTISASPEKTDEIFDSSDLMGRVASNLAKVETDGFLSLINNKHIVSLAIEDFLENTKDTPVDKTRIEELIAESEEFSRFLGERLRQSQRTGTLVSDESDASRELAMIKSSTTWKIANGAIRVFDEKLFPPHSRRRRLLSRFIHDPVATKDTANGLDSRLIQRIKGAEAGRRVLAITYEIPRFDRYSGAHRFFNLLQILKGLDFSVTVLSDNPDVQTNYSMPLQDAGIDIICEEYGFYHLMGLGEYFDFVMLHTPSTAWYIDLVRKYFQRAKVIFDTSDLHYLRFQREGEVTGNLESIRKSKEYKQKELTLARKSDMVFVVSDKEKEILEREVKGLRVEVIPNIHKMEPTSTHFDGRRDLMFIGAFSHSPNADAVFYFLEEIFPTVLKEIGANFYIIGNNPPQELLVRQNPNIIVTGYVADVTPYFEKCRLMVAPLRYGAGVKGKLTQSMSLGLPFVTTSIGAEGMGLLDHRHCFIVDDPVTFAERIIRLYTDRELWETFRENSLKLAAERFSYDAIKDRLRDIFSEKT